MRLAMALLDARMAASTGRDQAEAALRRLESALAATAGRPPAAAGRTRPRHQPALGRRQGARLLQLR